MTSETEDRVLEEIMTGVTKRLEKLGQETTEFNKYACLGDAMDYWLDSPIQTDHLRLMMTVATRERMRIGVRLPAHYLNA